MKMYFDAHISLPLFIMAATPFSGGCQSKAYTCADIKTGIFYFYPKNSADRFVETRDDKYMVDKNTIKGDSTIWDVEWSGNCQYTVKYVSGNTAMTDATMKFFKKHTLVYEVTGITADYYTFKGFVDKTGGNPIQVDTIWLSERASMPDNRLFKYVPNPTVLKKDRFSDTSQYAVLYIYRPGKLTNSLANYIVYFDDNVMCVAKNKSGYVFKILKEGSFAIQSRLFKDEASIKLDVQFGHTYYVKSMIHWTISSRLYNFKLDMQAMKPEDGQVEFSDVNLQ